MQGKKGSLTLDIAVLITIGAGYLFFIGWNYWKTYYGYFGIDQSMIVFPFNQIIVSAWSVLLIYFFGILYPIFSPTERLKGIEHVETSVDKLGLGILVAVYFIVFPFVNLWWVKIIIVAAFFIPFLFIWKYFGDKKLNFGNKIKDFHGIIFFSITILFFSLLLANQLANLHAKNYSNSTSKYKINIQLIEGDIKYEDYILIANMGGKYFISETLNGKENPNTIIIHESNVLHAELRRE